MFKIQFSKIFIIILLLQSFVLFSCSSIHKSTKNSSINISISAPMKARVEVDLTKKIVGYASGGFLFHLFQVSGDRKFLDKVRFNGEQGSFFSSFDNIQLVKSAAAYNAIARTNADVLVDPQYILEESSWNPFYKTFKVKVIGYAGKVVSIKNAE